MHYDIYSKSGLHVGVYKGHSKEEAFIDMIRCGGYTDEEVWLEGSKICYYSSDYVLLCGHIEDYKIIPI